VIFLIFPSSFAPPLIKKSGLIGLTKLVEALGEFDG
jgi:hypothetical protein